MNRNTSPRKWQGLLIVLFLGSLVGLWMQRKALDEIREQVEAVRRENLELRRSNLDYNETSPAQTENSELEKLRRDNADVHRLRNEIRRLREQAKDFQSMRAENERLRLQAQLKSADAARAVEPLPGIPVDPAPAALYSRKFKLSPSAITALIPTSDSTASSDAVATALRDFVLKAGVEIEAPKGLSFQEQTGQLLVRATLDDLDSIEKAIAVLNSAYPKAH